MSPVERGRRRSGRGCAGRRRPDLVGGGRAPGLSGSSGGSCRAGCRGSGRCGGIVAAAAVAGGDVEVAFGPELELAAVVVGLVGVGDSSAVCGAPRWSKAGSGSARRSSSTWISPSALRRRRRRGGRLGRSRGEGDRHQPRSPAHGAAHRSRCRRTAATPFSSDWIVPPRSTTKIRLGVAGDRGDVDRFRRSADLSRRQRLRAAAPSRASAATSTDRLRRESRPSSAESKVREQLLIGSSGMSQSAAQGPAWLVLPTYNEAENIERVRRRGPRANLPDAARILDRRRQLARRHRRDRRPARRRGTSRVDGPAPRRARRASAPPTSPASASALAARRRPGARDGLRLLARPGRPAAPARGRRAAPTS